MLSRLFLLGLLGLAACAGPSRTGSVPTSEQRMRDWASELEQLNVGAQLEGTEATCRRAPRVCDLARDICGVAAAEPSRQVFQERCRAAQEQCAGFRQRCQPDAGARAQLIPIPRSP